MKKVYTTVAALSFFLVVIPVLAATPNYNYGGRQALPTVPASKVNPSIAQTRPISPGPTQGVSVRSQKIQALVTRMLDSLQNRLDNYTDFLTKVKSRREKLFTAGKDVTRLDSFIAVATTNLAEAQAALNTAKSALTGLDYTANPGTIIQKVRDQLKLVRQAMTTLHKSMSQTVAEILSLSANVTPKPTKSVPQTTIQPGNKFGPTGNPGQGRGGENGRFK